MNIKKIIEISNVLLKYKKCFIENDFICMSSMVLPSVVESLGGVEGFVDTMASVPAFLEQVGMSMDASKMQFGDRGPIVTDDQYLVSVIPTTIPILINGQSAIIESSVIGFSGDNGETWFFIEGNGEGKMMIANESPRVLQKVDVPTPRLKMNGQTMIERNGQWIMEQ